MRYWNAQYPFMYLIRLRSKAMASKQYAGFPWNSKYAFSIIAKFFSPRPRGTVTRQFTNAKDNLVVDHNYLADLLDLTVLAEAYAFGNEIVMNGKGTKDIVYGA